MIGKNNGATDNKEPIGETEKGVCTNEVVALAHDEEPVGCPTRAAHHLCASHYAAHPLTSNFHIQPDSNLNGSNDFGCGSSGIMSCK
jgi:hypothetical protein